MKRFFIIFVILFIGISAIPLIVSLRVRYGGKARKAELAKMRADWDETAQRASEEN